VTRVRALLTLLAGLFLTAPALASAPTISPEVAEQIARAFQQGGGERILNFVSDVRVERNGDLDVTETIRLIALGQEMRHGIQRDFPTSYRNKLGQRTTVGFSVVSVERDGRPEPYKLIAQSNGKRVRIGDADTLLPLGEHSYVIRYRTTRQIAYGDAQDELYWNATGTGWTFPIDQAEARITLPSPAQFGDRAAYTGAQGSTDRDATVIAERPGYIAFATTAPLPREAGLTVAAAFPKGVLDPPAAGQRLRWWLADWGALGAGALGVIALLGYYFRAWLTVGRGPRAGTVVPMFTPPDGLSAAAARYISRMGLDDRAFTAAIVELGVRGQLRIRKEGDGWLSKGTTTLERTPDDRALPEPESAMLASLFSAGDSIALKQTNHSRLQGARGALEQGLEAQYLDTMFRRNREWAAFGVIAIALAMLAVALVGTMVRSPAPDRTAMVAPVIAFACLLGAHWLYRVTQRTTRGTKLLAWLGAAAFGFGAAIYGIAAVTDAVEAGQWSVLLPLLALPVALSAFAWIAAPTREGRAVMDRIAGFKQYLGITEEARLDTLHPPEKTPELFERYLPYAIALGVENRWAERFAGVLAAAAAAGATGSAMGWYAGSGNVWDDPGGFAGSVGSSLNSTISSASTSPSSSSGGSSGGGSSGGGGGGGGGSGW
jgi:uncharacterized membrane protein YgcG